MTRKFVESPPPPLAAGGLRVFAAGGLGEIGRNMTVFQFGTESMVVDCGVLFPTSQTPGVDLVLPDLGIFDRAGTAPTNIILTHGHEDHIGALPYLTRRYPDITIHGTGLTLAFARARLSEHGLNPRMIEIGDDETVRLGSFSVTAIAVAHSVPDGIALHIRVGDKVVIHTGDFKIDPDPLDGRLTNLRAFRSAGDEGVDLLLSDSTNADVKEGVFSERDITGPLNEIFASTRGRIIFACFASNVHRVQQAVSAAVAAGRKVCFTGRSMIRNMGIAQERGFLNVPKGAEVSFDDAIRLDSRRAALICTGSQGEPLSALARISRGEHKIRVSAMDTVVLSARLIPGNESDIFRVINGLSELGARVIHRENAQIHASGHAGAVALTQVIEEVRPKFLLPVHGEWRHLQAHAALAREAGMDDEQVMLLANGEVLDLVQEEAVVVGTYGHDDIYVDGTTVGHVGGRVFKDRNMMAEGGLIHVILALDPSGHAIGSSPRVELRGVTDSGSLRAEVKALAERTLAAWAQDQTDTSVLEDSLRVAIQRTLRKSYALQPLVMCTALTVPVWP